MIQRCTTCNRLFPVDVPGVTTCGPCERTEPWRNMSADMWWQVNAGRWEGNEGEVDTVTAVTFIARRLEQCR